jgi:hypothetical protein
VLVSIGRRSGLVPAEWLWSPGCGSPAAAAVDRIFTFSKRPLR